MDELTTWPSISVAAGGWSLFAALAWQWVRSLSKGDLITRREADAMQATISEQRAEIRDLREQNGLLLREAVPVVNSTFSALRERATSPEDRPG